MSYILLLLPDFPESAIKYKQLSKTEHLHLVQPTLPYLLYFWIMEWYEILGLVVVWVLGLYLRGKVYENKRKFYSGYSESWKYRKGK